MYHVAYGLSLKLKSSHEVIIMRLPVAFASTLISFSSFLLSIYFISFFPFPLFPSTFRPTISWWRSPLSAILATWYVLYDSEWHIRKAMHVSHFVLLYLFHFLTVLVFLHLYALRQPIRSHLLS
ncbi:hypothetical protein BDV24DRAFT_111264 [Aspergillus arachidicola]|uniref:Uncharacterized protein n=1 Tax=Aspergillus arachidicola TaxID=656916 RepID=A0A5N6XW33_9EURO|nr:hypothetical protein BDV24DRAFT_111264 [Aspergillus arachidicola]